MALLPLRGRADSAIPSTQLVMTPSRKTQAKVSHLSASVGSATSNAKRATTSSRMACSTALTITMPILPMK